jgi:hypothetical protein
MRQEGCGEQRGLVRWLLRALCVYGFVIAAELRHRRRVGDRRMRTSR